MKKYDIIYIRGDIMRPLEIPYNFDIALIDFLRIYFKGREDLIHSIYLPPFQGHYHSAKEYLPQESGIGITKSSYPTTITEYLFHINYINKYFPNKVMILLQQNNQLLKNDIEYVKEYNIYQYCENNIYYFEYYYYNYYCLYFDEY